MSNYAIIMVTEKVVDILEALQHLEEPIIADICREVDQGHANLSNTLSNMEDYGMIEMEKKNDRSKTVVSTEEGDNFLDAFQRLDT